MNTDNPFASGEILAHAVTRNANAVIELHNELLQEAKSDGYKLGEKSADKNLKIAAALVVFVIIGCIMYVSSRPSTASLVAERDEYKNSLTTQMEGRRQDSAKMTELAENNKALDQRLDELSKEKQEIIAKLTVTEKALADTDTKVVAAEKRAADLALLADKAKNADLYQSQVETARKERDEVKGMLEVSEAKVLDLEKALALRQQQPASVAVAVPIEQETTASGLPLTNAITGKKGDPNSYSAASFKADASVAAGLRRIAQQTKVTVAKNALNNAADALEKGVTLKDTHDLIIVGQGMAKAGLHHDAGLVEAALKQFRTYPN